MSIKITYSHLNAQCNAAIRYGNYTIVIVIVIVFNLIRIDHAENKTKRVSRFMNLSSSSLFAYLSYSLPQFYRSLSHSASHIFSMCVFEYISLLLVCISTKEEYTFKCVTYRWKIFDCGSCDIVYRETLLDTFRWLTLTFNFSNNNNKNRPSFRFIETIEWLNFLLFLWRLNFTKWNKQFFCQLWHF